MPALTTDHISIEVADTGTAGPLRLAWKGKGTDRNPAAVLRPYLEDALETARERSTSMELALEAVSYMNSSTFTCVVELVRAAREAKVPLALTYDRSVTWQQIGVEALRAFDAGDGLLSLRAVGDPR